MIIFCQTPRLKLKALEFVLCGSTSQILDEVLQFHFPLSFDVGAVHVCVEEDYGKGQDEDGVRVLELPNQGWITHTVSLTAKETETTCSNTKF